jgi:dolichyl-phosphate-mannose-protein mannosyltransferase
LALTIATWRKWPDVLIDFGRELYVPWQLSTGKVLYSEIAYFNGPFSPYFNALLFRIFGVSLTTLILSNLAILAVTTGMIYRFFRQVCDRLTATVCCCIFLVVFGFADLIETGNNNFVTPYSHELTHGIALATAMILCLRQYSLSRKRSHALMAGVLLGFVFLTKAEVFLAAAVTALLGFGLLHLVAPLRDRKTLALGFACVAILPAGLFFAFLAIQIPAGEALRGTAGTWLPLLQSDVTQSIYYKRSAGLDMPAEKLGMLFLAFAAVVLLAGAIATADLARTFESKVKRLLLSASLILFVLSCLIKRSSDLWLLVTGFPVPWMLLGASLPFVTLASGFVLLVALQRSISHEEKLRLLQLILWATFSLGLLGKLFLAPRLYEYGFALAMPASLMLVATFAKLMPDALRKLYGTGDLFRRVALAALVADALFFLMVSMKSYSQKTVFVGYGGDTIVAAEQQFDPRGIVVSRTLERIEALVPANATFLVLPEGVMLNYLTRRTNPTPYINFMPPEMLMFDESKILAAIRNHPPDFVLLTARSTGEYGVKSFGSEPGFGKQIMDWVKLNYSLMEQIAADPEAKHPFNIKILRRVPE